MNAITANSQVELLRRQFLQMVNVRELSFPNGPVLKQKSVQTAIFQSMFNNHISSSSKGYRYQVLKKILSLIEASCTDPDEDEILDELASHFGVLLEANHTMGTSPAVSEDMISAMKPQLMRVQYTPPQPLDRLASNPIHIDEAPSFFAGGGTTGHRTWEAALHLSHFLSQPSSPSFPAAVSGATTVLELGAGRGLVSRVCADVCGARKVIPTDGTGDLVDALRENLPRSSPDRCCWDPHVLDWETPYGLDSLLDPLDADAGRGGIDLILGADITFDETLLRPLAATIARLLTVNPSARTFIAATVRNEKTLQAFEHACSESESNATVLLLSFLPMAANVTFDCVCQTVPR